MTDTTPAPEAELTVSTLDVDMERRLSSIFVSGLEYGTRASTVILIDDNLDVSFIEQTYLPGVEAEVPIHIQFSIVARADLQVRPGGPLL